MKVKDILKKQTTVVAIAIVLVAIALIGVSYAIFFDVKANANNQIITAGTLKLALTDINALTIEGDSHVMVDNMGLLSSAVSYTVKNTDSNLPAAYSIYIYADSENAVELSLIKFSIDGDATSGITAKSLSDVANKFTENENTYYKIDSGRLDAGSTATTKYLRVWIDEDSVTEDIKNKKVSLNLYIISEVAEPPAKDYILANTILKTDTPNFDNTSCTKGTNNGGDCGEETVGLYCWDVDTNEQCTSTSTNKTYFYRGDVEDNYVKFADHYWRIIRINENGSLRLIYAGDASVIDSLDNKEEVLANGYNDSTTTYTQIGTSTFNTYYDQAEYVGFKYTLGEVHGTRTKSTILENNLEPWYQTNIVDKGLEEHIDKEVGFCGDRSAYTDSSGTTAGGGTGTTTTYYGGYIRNATNKEPSFECPNSEDLYKTSIGLITADEVAFAGGKIWETNYSYYVYTGNWYMTFSPYTFNGSHAYVFDVRDNGRLYGIDVGISNGGVRPVINLNTDKLTISGNGTAIDPYVIS